MTFEEKLYSGLKEAFLLSGSSEEKIREEKIGVAVSGGADSVSLLTALSSLIKKENLFAVTVNHNMRPENETSGDALYVQSLCREKEIECIREDIPRGEIERLSLIRGMGSEEAARSVRYEVFKKVCSEKNCHYLCLAHNRNDFLETVLMRLFQGGGASALSSIKACRKEKIEDGKEINYLRPMLDISRKEIEDYLISKKISWRNDSTNEDTSMLRNTIRKNIVPVLKSNVSFWDKGLLSSAEKLSLEEEVLEKNTEEAYRKTLSSLKKDEKIFSLDWEKFKEEPKAIRIRLLMKGVSALSASSRMPYTFVKSIASFPSDCADFSLSCSGISFSKKKEKLFLSILEDREKIATEEGFSVIIQGIGSFMAGDLFVNVNEEGGIISLESDYKNKKSKVFIPGLAFPFLFRSFQSGDTVKDAKGKEKDVSSVLDDFHAGKNRAFVPLVQELSSPEQNIILIWGSAMGLSDYLVKV